MDSKLERLLADPNSPVGAVYRRQYDTDDAFVVARRGFAERVIDRLTPMGINIDLAQRTCVVTWPLQLGGGMTNFSMATAGSFNELYQNIVMEIESRAGDITLRYADGELVNVPELTGKLTEAMETLGWRNASIANMAVMAATRNGRTLTLSIPSHKDADHVVRHLSELTLIEGDGHRGSPPEIAPAPLRVDVRRPYTVHDQAHIYERFGAEMDEFVERLEARRRLGIIRAFDVNSDVVEIIMPNGTPLQFKTFNYESFKRMLADIDRHFDE